MSRIKRGQVSMEFVIILGFLLVALIPITIYGTNRINTEIKIQKAFGTVDSIASAADSIYALGPGSKKFIYIDVPDSTVSTLVSGNNVFLNVRTFGGTSNISAASKAKLIGSIPKSPGRSHLSLEVLDNGTILLGGYDDSQAPSITYLAPSGTIGVQEVAIQANTDEDATCKYDTFDIAYASMSFSMEGQAQTHQESLGTLGEDTYVYYVRCKDLSDNAMQSSGKINFTVSINSSAYPSISLEGPINNTARNYSASRFSFNVSSITAGISLCNLIITGTTDLGSPVTQIVTDTSIAEHTPETFLTMLSTGNYMWRINCTDDSISATVGASASRYMRMNTPLTDVTSCPTWCNNQGLNDGACTASAGNCKNNCGLSFNQTYNCYAGSAGSSYCSQVCCCLI